MTVRDAGRATGQPVVGRQRGLRVQIEQQYAQTGIGNKAAEIGRDGGLTYAALGRNNGNHLHGLLLIGKEWGTRSDALVEAVGDPLINFGGIPADGANA